MDITKILSMVDHTLLAVDARWEDIRVLCNDAVEYGCSSVCIPPSFVKKVRDKYGDKLNICTVIGFPNGYHTTAVKCFEAECAVNDGADEIDMVINVTMVKDNRFEEILDEINAVKKACNGKLLKVIIETCLLTGDEKIRLCEVVSASDADYIKTSTGFSKGGATFDDIRLMAENCRKTLKIKAAGGIASLDDAEKFISLGASRLGTSRIVKLIKNQSSEGEY